jgi:hypothetical protein
VTANPLDPHDAAALLDSVRSVRRRALARLPGMRFPMLLFGCLALLSIPVTLAFGARGHGIYWSAAGPLGSLATAAYYVRSGRRIGLRVPGRPYVGATCVIVGGAAAGGMLGGILRQPALSVTLPPLALGAGLLLLARVERSSALGCLAFGLAIVDVGLLVGGVPVDAMAVALALAYGLPAVTIGISQRGRYR